MGEGSIRNRYVAGDVMWSGVVWCSLGTGSLDWETPGDREWRAAAEKAVHEEPTKLTVTLKDHKFSPAELNAPAGKPIVIEVANQDGTPAEFESKQFKVEKVVK